MKATSRGSLLAVSVLAGLLLTAGPASAGRFEDAVRAEWRGAWVVVGTEVYSGSGQLDTTSYFCTIQ